MAIADITQSTLQLTFQNGTHHLTGEPVYQTKSFSNVKPEATAEQLYAVATAFEGLQSRPLFSINRRDNSELRPS